MIEMHNPYIIAEIGVNHDGSFEKAIKLIDEAKKCGADAVKFQNFKTDKLIKKNTAKVKYQQRGDKSTESQDAMLRRLELLDEEFASIINYCRKLNIDFISTPYDTDAVDFLSRFDVKVFKVASADIVDHILIQKILDVAENIILSTGMATITEVDDAVDLVQGTPCGLALLHCTSNYPCSDESVNLRTLEVFREKYNVSLGFSDHTTDFLSATLALSLGAIIFEKHFTLDKNLPGPDHAASSDPDDFKKYCSSLHRAKNLLGVSEKIIFPEELEMRAKARKSLRYSENFEPGHIISSEDLIALRPGDGFYTSQKSTIIGRKLNVAVKKHDLVQCGDYET